MSGYVNPANAMTAARFLTIPPFVFCADRGHYQWGIIVLTVCALLDVFDGKVAKLFRCTSAFGEMFDAVADAVCYGSFFLILAIWKYVPWPPLAVILCAGLVNVGMRAVYSKRAGRAVNYRSWAMERVVGYMTWLIGAGLMRYEVLFYFWAVAVVMLVVLVHDAKRMLVDPIPPESSTA